MDFELQWLLIGMPVVFALGWMASRFDLRQLKKERSDAPRAYFKGLNLLLNEQQDKAIDAFIEAVQNDPDTAELHFALGNLFRRRGEFERAVRVHQHLLNRADLRLGERHRAQHALAQDFMKAGLFDRAEAAYKALRGTAFDADAQLALLSLYERSHDWEQAVVVARALDKTAAGAGSFATRIAHAECELALQADSRGDRAAGDAALQRARDAAPQAPRPLVLAGQRLLAVGDAAQALSVWQQLQSSHPTVFLLVAEPYAQAAKACGQEASARQALLALLQTLPAVELLRALQVLEGADTAAQTPRLLAQIQTQPSLSAVQMLLAQKPTPCGDDVIKALRRAVDAAAAPQQRYRCAACGFEAQHHYWQCPGCLNWDSYPPQRMDGV
jgi:lipopolysaccharide assembly protein B